MATLSTSRALLMTMAILDDDEDLLLLALAHGLLQDSEEEEEETGESESESDDSVVEVPPTAMEHMPKYGAPAPPELSVATGKNMPNTTTVRPVAAATAKRREPSEVNGFNEGAKRQRTALPAASRANGNQQSNGSTNTVWDNNDIERERPQHTYAEVQKYELKAKMIAQLAAAGKSMEEIQRLVELLN